MPGLGARDLTGDHADLARRREPDAGDRDQAEDDREPERRRVAADPVVDPAGEPRPAGGAEDRGAAERAEDGAEVPALEQLGRDRAVDRGEAVAEQPLDRDHQIDQRRARPLLQREQAEIAQDEAQGGERPGPFAPDAGRTDGRSRSGRRCRRARPGPAHKPRAPGRSRPRAGTGSDGPGWRTTRTGR